MIDDTYSSFKELRDNETEGIDYCVNYRKKTSKWAVITPHGGGIEPGTSELVKAVADDNHSYYSFEGTKTKDNKDLHITSELFDEKQGDEIARSSENIIVFHGCIGYPDKIFIGGLDVENRKLLALLLKKAGFTVDDAPPTELSGTKLTNICNRGLNGRGIQLELDLTVRKKLFRDLNRKGRKERLPAFRSLVETVRKIL